MIHPLKYSQSHQPLGSPLSPPLNGLTITAFNSGHTLGGTIWHIQHGLESIVYAVDWNQARENVISGAAWLGGAGGGEVTEQLRKPTAMVCSAKGAGRTASVGGRKKRDEVLLNKVRTAVARGGIVLIPTDSSARMIELAYLLEHAWRSESANGDAAHSVKNAKLYLAARSAGMTMRYARSMLEWMDESIVREFEAEGSGNLGTQPTQLSSWQSGARGGKDRRAEQAPARRAGPFDFEYLQLVERQKDLERVLKNAVTAQADAQHPGIVLLASDTSLQWGFARYVLRRIAADGRNLMMLTERYGGVGTDEDGGLTGLGRGLWDIWQEATEDEVMDGSSGIRNSDQVSGDGRELLIREAQRVPLEGNELLVYQQYLATKQQLQNTLPGSNKAIPTSSLDAADDSSSDESTSSDESDSERQGKALNVSATLANSSRNKLQLTNEELGVNVLLRRKGVYDFFIQGKKGRDRMFPFVARRRRDDEFGEIIRPDEYLKAEEREEVGSRDIRAPALGKTDVKPTLGQKRKWEDAEASTTADARRALAGTVNSTQNPPTKIRKNTHRRNASGPGEDAQPSLDEDTAVESDDDPLDPLITGPSKVVFRTETVQINLEITFVDFSGLHDKRSLQMLIPLIEPRKLILVEGSKEETLSLAADCRQLLGVKSGGEQRDSPVDVFTPVVGRTVDASVDTNAWTVKLSEPLAKRLHWQKVRGLSIVHINGLLAAKSTADDAAEVEQVVSKKQRKSASEPSGSDHADKPPDTELQGHILPVLESVPTSLASSTRSVAQPLHVGDLRLADLKKLLQASGHVAEFRGEGTLLVDGQVAIRKTGAGRIEVESGSSAMLRAVSDAGQFEETFQAVKRRIYEGLAVVAGA